MGDVSTVKIGWRLPSEKEFYSKKKEFAPLGITNIVLFTTKFTVVLNENKQTEWQKCLYEWLSTEL